jgi:hypothetical protein
LHTILEITRPSAEAYDRLPINRHNGRHQVDTESIERAVQTILEAVGEDLQRPGCWTPRGVLLKCIGRCSLVFTRTRQGT